jgi:predicted RNA-binding protein with RPS1 domain
MVIWNYGSDFNLKMLNKNEEDSKANLSMLKDKMAQKDNEFRLEIEKLNSSIKTLKQINAGYENQKNKMEIDFNEKLNFLRHENKRLYESKYFRW